MVINELAIKKWRWLMLIMHNNVQIVDLEFMY